jgi:predicted RNA-binding protein with PUA-like domain
MAYWLMKSEPDVYSWDRLVKDGKTKWDGVRNYTARNNLRAMQVGDEVLFYHSNEGKACVGIAKIVKTAEPDTTVEKDELTAKGENPWLVVTIAPVKPLKTPVTLEMVKQTAALKDMELLKYQRLSVQKVTPGEWKTVLKLSGA